MKKLLHIFLSLAVSLCILTSVFVPINAISSFVASASSVLSYSVYRANTDVKLQEIYPNTTVDIEITLQDDNEISEVVKGADSFSRGISEKTQIKHLGAGTYSIKFLSLRYTGTGNTLSFNTNYNDLTSEYKHHSVNIIQCVPNTESSSSSDSDNDGEIEISIVNTPIIYSSERVSVPITIKNKGKKASLENVEIALTISEGATLLDGDLTLKIDHLKPQETKTFNVLIKGDNEIKKERIILSTSTNYVSKYYESTKEISAKTHSFSFSSINLTSDDSVVLSLGQVDVVKEGENFTIPIIITNNSKKYTISKPSIDLAVSAGLTFDEMSDSFFINDIAPNSSETLYVKATANKKLETSSIAISATLNYHQNGNALSTKRNLLLKAIASAEPSSSDALVATPHIIVKSYNFGDEHVLAGEDFDLELNFANTSHKLNLDNIIVTIDTGQSFTITSSSNTFSYESLLVGETKTITLPVKALTSATSGGNKISVAFSFEYINNNQRQHSQDTETISIPVTQPDRFEASVDLSGLDYGCYVDQEFSVTVNCINKGKAEISNLEAELLGADDESPIFSSYQPKQHIGNITAGNSSNIDFIITPLVEGENTVNIKLSYEDANATVKEMILPVTFIANVMNFGPSEPIIDDMMIEDNGANLTWLWITLGIGVPCIIIAAIIIIVVAAKKRKKRTKTDDNANSSTNNSSNDDDFWSLH